LKRTKKERLDLLEEKKEKIGFKKPSFEPGENSISRALKK
jgi:hypothetical protein